MVEQIIDACCLINLYASGNIKDVISASGATFHVSEQVRSESLLIRQVDPNDPLLLIPFPIDLTEAIANDLLKECDFESETEMRLFAEFATEIDDGEASCFAIAKSRGWLVATDDLKATRIATQAGIRVISTPELIERWVKASIPASQEISEAVLAIERFARFRPRRANPLYDWWLAVSVPH